MEQLFANVTIETENAVTSARLTWRDVLVGAVMLAVFAGATWQAMQPQAQQPSGLVVVTRNVCQPTPLPTVGSAVAPYQTVP